MTTADKTPRTDRETYTVSKADIGFKVTPVSCAKMLESDLAAANERLERLRGLAKALTDRMDELSSALQGVFTFYHAHGMKWPSDANWAKEFKALCEELEKP